MTAAFRRRAVFSNLDGTLGGNGLGDVFSFSFYPSAVPALRLINQTGLLAIVVTNESRVARGDFTLADFERRMSELRRGLAEAGAWLDAVYVCPHSSMDRCACRKPLPGLLYQAQRDHDLDLAGSYVVGDTGAWDVVLARVVGCTAILVRTGLGESSLTTSRHLWADLEPDYIADDVLAAARWIASQEAGT